MLEWGRNADQIESLVVLGVCVMLFMPSYPEKASWLSDDEKALSEARLGTHAARGHVFCPFCVRFLG